MRVLSVSPKPIIPNNELKKFHSLIQKGVNKYSKSITFKWVAREKNTDADLLSRSVYDTEEIQLELEELRQQRIQLLYGDDDIPW